MFAPGEAACEGCGEGGVETPCSDRTTLDAGAAADTARRVGVRLVAPRDGLRRADRGAAAAMGAAVGIACGQVDDRVFLLPAAVAHDETDEAQHRHERRVHVLQFCGVDRGRRSRREFFAHRGAELRGPGEVLRVGASCGDGGFGGAVRVLADECCCGHGDESLPGGERDQLRGGLFEGPVAVDRDHHGGRSRAAERFQSFCGRRGHMSPVDGGGDDRHGAGRQCGGVCRGVRQVDGFQGGGFGPGVGGDAPGYGLGDFFRSARRREDDGADGFRFHGVGC